LFVQPPFRQRLCFGFAIALLCRCTCFAIAVVVAAAFGFALDFVFAIGCVGGDEKKTVFELALFAPSQLCRCHGTMTIGPNKSA